MAEAQAAAATLLKWLDDLLEPGAVALAIAQAEYSYAKAMDISGNEEAAKLARVRRFLESIARGNYKLLRALDGPADGGEG